MARDPLTPNDRHWLAGLHQALIEAGDPDGGRDPSLRQLALLIAIEAPRSHAEAMRACNFTSVTMSRSVTRLEAYGWLDRRRSAGDRRTVEIVITAEGRRYLARLAAARLTTGGK